MLEDMSKDALFYNYYTQWIEVYKKDAIREATMAKYRICLLYTSPSPRD